MAPKGKSKTAKSTPSTKESEQSQLPNWPPFAPLVPVENLYVEEVVENQILVIRNFFTSKLCKDYITFLSSLPLTTTPGKPRRGEATRVNDRFQIDDPTLAQRLWEQTSLRHLVENYTEQKVWNGEVLGLNSNIRIYRYRPGQFFDQHYDESNKLQFGSDKIPARTTWTLLIYLSVCEGGETAFYPEPGRKGERQPDPVVCSPEIGLALLHKHGDDCMLHEGKEVLSGEKWVLRSDLVVKR